MEGKEALFTTSGITDSERILHTPSEFAKKALLYVQEVGKLQSLKPHKSQRENLDSYLFLCVTAGEGTITVGTDFYKVKEGNCALIDCRNYYAHESSENNPWQLMWVHFDGNLAELYYNLFLENNDQKNIFESRNSEEIQKTIRSLIDYQKRKDLISELLTGEGLLHLINTCIFTVMYQDKYENHRTVCNEIREYVNGRYQETFLMKTFEERYKTSAEELNSSFKKMYGIALEDYILNRRFTAAKELLRFTVKPVEKIVKESGIENRELFKKLFESEEGMTAEEYRMKWSQWVK